MGDTARSAADALEANAETLARHLAANLPLGKRGDELLADLTYLVCGLAAAVGLRSTGLADLQLEWQKARTVALGGDAEAVVRLPGVLLEAAAPLLTADQLERCRIVLRHAGEYVRHASATGREGWTIPVTTAGYCEAVDRFLAAAQAGDRVATRAEALAVGDPADAVQLLLEPALREVGRRWMSGEITPRDEHLISAVIHDCLQELLAAAPPLSAKAPLVALVRPGGEEHSMGQAMLEIYLRANGYRTRVVVSRNLPLAIDQLAALQPNAIAVSCAAVSSLRATADLIASVRADLRLAGLPLLVGGRVFVDVPQLATQLGADAGGVDGRRAATLIRSLVPA